MIITVYSVYLTLVSISNIFIDTCSHHIVANKNIKSQKLEVNEKNNGQR